MIFGRAALGPSGDLKAFLRPRCWNYEGRVGTGGKEEGMRGVRKIERERGNNAASRAKPGHAIGWCPGVTSNGENARRSGD